MYFYAIFASFMIHNLSAYSETHKGMFPAHASRMCNNPFRI